ncbi:hypothetical protein CK501_06465 [Halovibrio salipaludis]|uniref:Glycosyltransferase 2-like domain-containing protein n=1 Tax=Halovibrio salipaludis TaxID=2032626 RepID=A0A2A2F8E8_9GAMM|nr:glycosyltransferase family A protein [Halovibrio salipaludis]PAU81198.1 hypothetical protein CK501_06465 [Halovibrio salipaludis]
MTDSRSPDKPLVSILLVTANRADHLDAPIDSVLAQTETRWELIAVDCGSTDGTLERLEAWASDERIRVISVEETNRAIGRREALGRAKGAFVAFLDPQTVWPTGFLETLAGRFAELPDRTGVMYARTEIADEEGHPQRMLPPERHHGSMVQELFEQPCFPLSALMIRHTAVRPLEKTGKGPVLANDHTLLLWLAHRTPFEPAPEALDPIRIHRIDGALPLILDSVSEQREEAMNYALEHFTGAVPARFARRSLASFHNARARALAAGGDSGEALTQALRALMYRPLWPRAWRQVLRIAVRG